MHFRPSADPIASAAARPHRGHLFPSMPLRRCPSSSPSAGRSGLWVTPGTHSSAAAGLAPLASRVMDVLWTIFYLDFVDLQVSIALIWMDSLVVQVQMQ